VNLTIERADIATVRMDEFDGLRLL
jgi:hypothetical protein